MPIVLHNTVTNSDCLTVVISAIVEQLHRCRQDFRIPVRYPEGPLFRRSAIPKIHYG